MTANATTTSHLWVGKGVNKPCLRTTSVPFRSVPKRGTAYLALHPSCDTLPYSSTYLAAGWTGETYVQEEEPGSRNLMNHHQTSSPSLVVSGSSTNAGCIVGGGTCNIFSHSHPRHAERTGLDPFSFGFLLVLRIHPSICLSDRDLPKFVIKEEEKTKIGFLATNSRTLEA